RAELTAAFHDRPHGTKRAGIGPALGRLRSLDGETSQRALARFSQCTDCGVSAFRTYYDRLRYSFSNVVLLPERRISLAFRCQCGQLTWTDPDNGKQEPEWD